MFLDFIKPAHVYMCGVNAERIDSQFARSLHIARRKKNIEKNCTEFGASVR